MRVLITGMAGFIGSRLAEALLHHGHEVYGIDNLSTGREGNVPDQAHLIVGDIREDIPPGPWDVIYHAAASYKDREAWESDATTNLDGTIAVIREAQRHDSRIVYFQTSLCYGPNPVTPVQINAPLDPRGSYAVSKTAAESYIRDSGVSYVSLRLANMYGPRNLSGPVPAFYKRLAAGEPCTVVDSRRDFMYVDDLIWVAVKAATQGDGVYHVSSGADAPISAVYLAVGQAMGVAFPEPAIVPRGPDDVATLLLDPMRTRAEFGWEAKTPLNVGIERAVRWYEANGVMDVYTHLKG
jgi:UDP-glucose 4-epimerase